MQRVKRAFWLVAAVGLLAGALSFDSSPVVQAGGSEPTPTPTPIRNGNGDGGHGGG